MIIFRSVTALRISREQGTANSHKNFLPFSFMDVKKIRETLRTHSRFIRDYLAPTLATEGYQVSLSDRNTLKALFASLLATPITKSALQYSHIHKALFMITAGGAPWPYEYAMLAETVLEQWENCLGSLKEIKSDLWGPDGRLHGLRRIRDSGVGLSPDEVCMSLALDSAIAERAPEDRFVYDDKATRFSKGS